MRILPTDFSALSLTRAVEANFEDFFRNLSCLPSVEVSDTAEMLRFCTGVPDWIVNGVMRSRLTGVDLDAQIEDALDYFRSRRLPMMWLVSPSTQPAELGHHLKAHGLTHLATIPGMAADLQTLPFSMLLPPAVTIEEVGDDG